MRQRASDYLAFISFVALITPLIWGLAFLVIDITITEWFVWEGFIFIVSSILAVVLITLSEHLI